MKKYAKIVNEETKACIVGDGTKTDFYQHLGMVEMDVEESHDGFWYVKGYAPTQPTEELQAEIRAKRNAMLDATDKYVSVPDFPITVEEKDLYIQYRTYLRDYTLNKNWWLSDPLEFDTWVENIQEQPEIGAEIMETTDAE